MLSLHYKQLLFLCMRVQNWFRLLSVLIMVDFGLGLTALIYLSLSQRWPFSYSTFNVGSNFPYLLMKYQNSFFRIYLVCYIAQLVTFICSCIALPISLLLVKIKNNGLDPSNQSESLERLLYFLLSIAVIGQTIVGCYFAQMSIELMPQHGTDYSAQIIITVLSGTNILILLLSVVVMMYVRWLRLQFGKPTESIKNQCKQPQKVEPAIIKQQQDLIRAQTHLNAQYQLTPQNKNKQTYINSTSHNQPHILQTYPKDKHRPIYSNILEVDFKQPLLQQNKEHQDQDENSQLEQLPINLHFSTNKTKTQRQNIPKLRIDKINKKQENTPKIKIDNFSFSQLQISAIAPNYYNQRSPTNLNTKQSNQEQMSEGNSILSHLHIGKIPQQVDHSVSKKNLHSIKLKLRDA